MEQVGSYDYGIIEQRIPGVWNKQAAMLMVS